MSGLGRLVAPILATACGIFTAYTAFQPEFAQQQEERQGNFKRQHESSDDHEKAISNAIMSDLKEARDEATQRVNSGGFAWGIRKALFGYDPRSSSRPSTPGGDINEAANNNPESAAKK